MDEAAAFEHRLTRAAHARVADAGAGELDGILRRVAARRARRAIAASEHAQRGIVPSSTPTRAPVPTPVPFTPSGRVASIEPVAPDVRIIRVGRPPALQFQAGQYVKLGVPGNRSGSYSIASTPHEPLLEFCIELIPGGRLTPALFALRAGAEVNVTDRAKGKFVLDPRATMHLMIATVTGIAPLRSMLRDALHRGTAAEFVVLHGASHADELAYYDELTELAATDPRVRYVATVSRPSAARNTSWHGETGRVDDLACRVASTFDPRRTHVYACGHPEMVKRVAGELGSAFPVSTEVFD